MAYVPAGLPFGLRLGGVTLATVTSYTSIAAPVEAEIEAKRSRFLARLEPVADEETARAVVETARRQHWDARHHCSAFVLGPDGATTRCSDDGEPSGTAGSPMLEVLTGRALTDVVAVVTRWFGGTLLGTGGLVRAYSDAVVAAVAVAETVTFELRELADVRVPMAESGRLENTLRSAGYGVTGADYAQDVTLHITVPVDRRDDLTETVAAATAGIGVVQITGTDWARI